MNSFSKRHGYIPEKPLQFESLDHDLRMIIWEFIRIDLFPHYSEANLYKMDYKLSNNSSEFYHHFCYEISKVSQDEANSSEFLVAREVKQFIYSTEKWFLIYDLLEIYMSILTNRIDLVNKILEDQKAAYRADGNGCIVPITNQTELDSINEAVESQFNGVRTHLQKAISYFADRTKPDYHNSIKESISAVESICCQIVGNESASLGDALKVLERHHELHPALKSSFSTLYGYTSNEEGIRHAIFDDPNKVGFTEAYFMLITCSAFINYLGQKFKHINN